MADQMPRDVSGDPYAIPANRIGDPPADADPAQAEADYWSHPARREIKRLLDLGDANAILDELQNGTTEWDDAREALDNLVRAADMRAVALGEALAATEAERDVARDGLKDARQMIGDALHATPDARSWEQLHDNIFQKGRALKNAQALVSQRAGEREEANGRANRPLEAIVKAEAERDEARAEAEQLRGLLGDAKVQYESARARADELLGQRDALRAELAEPVTDEAAATILRILRAGDGTRSGANALERVIRQTEKERDRLAEQVRVLAKYVRGEMLCDVHLDDDPDCAGCRERALLADALNAQDGGAQRG